jgi:zinc protease
MERTPSLMRLGIRVPVLRLLCAAALFALLGAASSARAAVKIEHWNTSTGARVHFVQSRAIPAFDVAVEFPAGSGWDPLDRSGLAGLTLALLKADSRSFNETQLSQRLADVGAQLGESFDRDRAGFTLRSLSSAPERNKALDTLSAMLSAPLFPPAALERERARAIATVQEAETRPGEVAQRRLYAQMYPGHPYGLSPTAESLARVARNDIEQFYRGRYLAELAVVTLVGDLSLDDAKAVAERLTAGLPRSKAPPVERPPAAPAAQGRTERVARPTAQSHVLLGAPAMARNDPDYFPLLVGNYSLGGGGFVSRLYREVREKRGYAYSVYSYFLPLAVQGPFQVGLQTRNEQADEALDQTRKVVAEFIARGPTAEELAAAKRALVGSFPLRLDSNRKLLDQVSVIGFYRMPLDWLDQFTANVERVELEHVRGAFARHLDAARLVTVVVGAPKAAGAAK